MNNPPTLLELTTGEKHLLEKPEFTVGRSLQADLPVTDSSCGRRHFRIVNKENQFVLHPLNPTQVNGQTIDGPQLLQHGAEIVAGQCRFQFLERDEPATQRPASATPSAPQPKPAAKPASKPAPRTTPQPKPQSAAQRSAGPPALPPRANSSQRPPTRQPPAEPDPEATRFEPAPFVEASTLERPIGLEGTMVIGRDETRAQIHIPHPNVSRNHAQIERRSDGVLLTDLRSANGTFVNGERLTRTRRLEPGDRIEIGPYTLTYQPFQLLPHTRSNNVELSCYNLTHQVPDRTTRQPRTILDDVTIVVHPKEFVCLIGPSGAGKSTLLSALSARTRASAGHVCLNEEDLYANFEALKSDIAVVPQSDVLHDHLRVGDALAYTAKLRLPPDTSFTEIDSAVGDMLATVGLEERRQVPICNLSGGQVKRASLANEIVSKPSLLFLDEVTSGLDEQTDYDMMKLFRKIADAGKTVLCVTHSLANVEQNCDLVVVLANGGKLAFVGSPQEALEYFGVKRLGEIYERLNTGKSADQWRDDFLSSPFYGRYVTQRLKPLPESARAPGGRTRKEAWKKDLLEAVRQADILTRRYVADKLSDLRSLVVMALQSLLVAVLIVLVFGDMSEANDFEQAGYSSKILFLMSITCFWFGCNCAAKEIVKERSIYVRERDVNLRISAYLTSKILLLGVLTLVQAALLVVVVRLFCNMPGSFFGQSAVLLATTLAGVGFGLLISAISTSEDMAVTFIPILLIPQIILAGFIAELEGLADFLADGLITCAWSYYSVSAILPDGLTDLLGTQDNAVFFAFLVILFHLVLVVAAAWIVLFVQGRRENVIDLLKDRVGRR